MIRWVMSSWLHSCIGLVSWYPIDGACTFCHSYNLLQLVKECSYRFPVNNWLSLIFDCCWQLLFKRCIIFQCWLMSYISYWRFALLDSYIVGFNCLIAAGCSSVDWCKWWWLHGNMATWFHHSSISVSRSWETGVKIREAQGNSCTDGRWY